MIEKFTYSQVVDYLVNNDKDIEDMAETFRECSHCGEYVFVDDQSSEVELEEYTYYDVCDECCEVLSDN